MDIDLIMSTDGRRVVDPPSVLSTRRVKAYAVKRMIEVFLAQGWTTHSSWGMFVPFILAYCEKHEIPYELTCRPGMGYMVKRLDRKLK